MFLLKRKTLQESLSVQMDLNRESEEGLILDKRKILEKFTNCLISPITHLFPLSGQLGSRGVSSVITLNSKYGILKNVIKVYNPAWQDKIRTKKKGKNAKKLKRMRIPPGGWRVGSKEPTRRYYFLLLRVTIIRKLICTLVLVIWDPKAYNKLVTS